MSAEPGSRGQTLLLVVAVAAAGYAAWQVAPLSRRMDEIDRNRLETSDRLQREVEKLRDELARSRLLAAAAGTASAKPSAAVREPAPQGAADAATSAAAPSPPAARLSRTDAETFFSRRLLSEDAKIATLLVENVPPREIALRLRHSVAFVIAKGIQIEKQLADAPETPPEILAALRAAVERAKSAR